MLPWLRAEFSANSHLSPKAAHLPLAFILCIAAHRCPLPLSHSPLDRTSQVLGSSPLTATSYLCLHPKHLSHAQTPLLFRIPGCPKTNFLFPTTKSHPSNLHPVMLSGHPSLSMSILFVDSTNRRIRNLFIPLSIRFSITLSCIQVSARVSACPRRFRCPPHPRLLLSPGL